MNKASPTTEPRPPDLHDRTTITISVIVPVLSESDSLPACLERVSSEEGSPEIIVVDAGSIDGSAILARSLGATVLVSTVAQRASQMNLGAETARGAVLVFLHADTLLPAGWVAALQRELSDRPEIVGGVFRRRFLTPSRFLRMTCRLADWRARQFGWFLGDQTIFVRRKSFFSVGGFPPMAAFEDLEFSRRLTKEAPTTVLPLTAWSSGRRFAARGPMKQTLFDLMLTARYLQNPKAFSTQSQEVARTFHTHLVMSPQTVGQTDNVRALAKPPRQQGGKAVPDFRTMR